MNTVTFFALHVPLGLVMFRSPEAATLHALVSVAAGMWWATSSPQLERVAYIAAYITGAEVLWRMCDAHVFWEFGKYSCVLIFGLFILRFGRLSSPLLPRLYFLLLLPSAVLTIIGLDPNEARRQLSFNLSGPLALMVSLWFFSYLRLSAAQLQQAFVSLIGPVIGIGAIMIFTILTTADIEFTNESNFVVSGGHGPNQVSSVLGLAAMLSGLYAWETRADRYSRLLMTGLAVGFGGLSALTLSRGGLYNAVAGAVVGALFLLRDARSRVQFALVAVIIVAAANYVLLPRLDAFTGGALTTRFHDTNLSQRDRIARADIEIFKNNIVLGVGPGQAKVNRGLSMHGEAAHTEFTRLLAEHGLLGVTAICLLMYMTLGHVRAASGHWEKAMVIALTVWSLIYMLNSGMRLLAPSFVLGLAAVGMAPGATPLPRLPRAPAPVRRLTAGAAARGLTSQWR